MINNPETKIIVEMNDMEASVKFPHSDVTIGEMLEAFRSILVIHGYSDASFINYCKEIIECSDNI